MSERPRILTTNNVVEFCDVDPDMVIEELQGLIDDPDLDIPDAMLSTDSVKTAQARMAYYSNLRPYLVGLWGRLRVAVNHAETKEQRADRTAMRDYLEAVVSACKGKYEGTSRIFTGFEVLQKEQARDHRTY